MQPHLQAAVVETNDCDMLHNDDNKINKVKLENRIKVNFNDGCYDDAEVDNSRVKMSIE